MSSFDQDVYLRLGELIVGVAPSDSEKVIVVFKVLADATSSEGAVYELMYDYIDKTLKRTWFVFSDHDLRRKIRELFVSLREFTTSQGQPLWNQCEFVLDMTTERFSVGFKYD